MDGSPGWRQSLPASPNTSLSSRRPRSTLDEKVAATARRLEALQSTPLCQKSVCGAGVPILEKEEYKQKTEQQEQYQQEPYNPKPKTQKPFAPYKPKSQEKFEQYKPKPLEPYKPNILTNQSPAELQLLEVLNQARTSLNEDVLVVLLERATAACMALYDADDTERNDRLDRLSLCLADVVRQYTRQAARKDFY